MMKMLKSVAIASLLAATALAVRPAAQTCDFQVSPTIVELDGSAQRHAFSIQTQPGCAWTVEVGPYDTWLHPVSSGGTGSTVLSYDVDAMPVPVGNQTVRQALIRVRWNTPTAGQNVVVTQTGAVCNAFFFQAFSGTPTSALTMGWKGAAHSFEVQAELPFSGPWRILNAPDWIVLTNPPLGMLRAGDGGFLFYTTPNPSTSPRDGTITFCSGQTATIHQAGRSLSTGNAVPADFDGDGIADPAVYRPSNGTWYALKSSSGYSTGDYLTAQIGATGTPLPGDFDGDNTAEVAMAHPTSVIDGFVGGNVNLRYSSNGYNPATQTTYVFPHDYENYTPHNLPLMADFNGDGKLDYVSWRPDTAEWAVGVTDYRFPTRLPAYPSPEAGHAQWGLPGDVPVPADFDGDHLADLAVWRPSTGVWWIRKSSDGYSTSTASSYQWGLPGDTPIVADFDGDGRTDLTVWRPSEGAWYVNFSSTGYNPAITARIQWGLTGDIPVANDYDGDGRTDLAVWRPSNGTWYILLSSRGFGYDSARIIQWGLPGDVPLSGRITGSQ